MNPRQRKRWRHRIGLGMALVTTGLAAVLVLYGLAAMVFGLIPVNRSYAPTPDGIDVYLRSNGVHVDLVVPLEAAGVDWRIRMPTNALGLVPGITETLAFGWGDRGFYLATPTWADVRVSTALRALTGVGTTVLHVEATTVPKGPATRHVTLSAAQYRRLAQFIESSFRRDGTGAAIILPGAHYGLHDAFFESTGHYSAFETCNEWTRQGLVTAGVRAPMWSPFQKALLYQLPQDD
jgi:uncharacterized protein (TIGR02117 family)